jgi:hypothetical protein
MIINKSCAFQLPFTVEMQKNIFWRSKKISKSPEKFCDFFRVAAENRKSIGTPDLRQKNGPSSEGPLESVDDITLVRVV